jgi:hypothetical protein
MDGLNLDRPDAESPAFHQSPELLFAEFDEMPVIGDTDQQPALKSNCLVTGQPRTGGSANQLHRPTDQPQEGPPREPVSLPQPQRC